MSTTYTGQRLISAVASTTPIQVTTSTPHGLTTGAVVTIIGSAVGAANGQFTITQISGTVFSLNGTSASGTSGAAGAVYVMPTAITIPSDGDTRNASSVNAAFDGLMDGLVALSNTQGALRSQSFSTPGALSFIPPPGCNFVIVAGCGGGGGGGGGAQVSNTNTTDSAGGGGGGGAAPWACTILGCSPGTAISGTVGTGGSAGTGATTAASSGGVGGDGTDSTFGSLTFGGAKGGAGGSPTGGWPAGEGGTPSRQSPLDVYIASQTVLSYIPGFGGNGGPHGGTVSAGTRGGPGPATVATGGSGGTSNGGGGTNLGGGGGGGGAHNVLLGGAGNGGNGGNGVNGAPTVGSAGGAATRAGAGGGGGGGGGANQGGTAANGGSGGAGGNGTIIIAYVAGPAQ